MQYNTPKILIESASVSTSFITTDTARFEEAEGKLYYVASGTAYNVALDKFGFDLKPSNNSFNALSGQSITAKVIKDYGYNFKYEVWCDISNVGVTDGYLYPHIYNGSTPQDVIDYFFASHGMTAEFNNKIYKITAQANTYNMPVLSVANK